jgi:hypothetical protein
MRTYNQTNMNYSASRPAPSYYDPADRQARLARMEERDSVSDYEVRFKRKDGTPVWIVLALLAWPS